MEKIGNCFIRISTFRNITKGCRNWKEVNELYNLIVDTDGVHYWLFIKSYKKGRK